VIPVGKEEKAI